MSKLFKMHGSTPVTGPSLCHSCIHGQITKGHDFQEHVWCHRSWHMPTRITFSVAECSMHVDRTKPTLQEMKEIAWEVQSRPRGPVGFAGTEVDIQITPPDPNKQPPGQPTQR